MPTFGQMVKLAAFKNQNYIHCDNSIIKTNLADRPCDVSVDWCGWKNVHCWKRIKYKELNQGNQDDVGDDKVDGNAQDDEGNFDTDSKDLFVVFLFL